jgi:hypothetical protein
VPGPLKNPKHEAFVRGLLENKTALAAYEAAGYARDDGNAARLSRNPKVQKRLAELQTEVTNETKVTVAGLISELEAARKAATNLEQFSTVVKSIEAKARISGLLVEKKQVEVGGPGDFDGMWDTREIALKAVDGMFEFSFEPYHDFTEADRQRLAEIFLESMNTFHDASKKLIEEVRARPLKTSYRPPKQLLPPPYANGRTR